MNRRFFLTLLIIIILAMGVLLVKEQPKIQDKQTLSTFETEKVKNDAIYPILGLLAVSVLILRQKK